MIRTSIRGTGQWWILGSATAVVICLGSLTPALADVGTTAMNFLKLESGARQAGMGGGATALGDDVNASRHNPAALALLKTAEGAFTYTNYLQDVHYEHGALAMPTRVGTFAFRITSLGYGTIEGYDANDQRTANVEAGSLAAGLGYGRDFGRGISAGLNVSILRERLAFAHATTHSWDLGVLYRVQSSRELLSKLQAGLSIENIGPRVTFVEEPAPLPRQIVMGVGLREWKERMNIYGELHVPNDRHPYMSGGGEYWWQRVLALRMGYAGNADTGPGFHIGVGFRWRALQLDYAWRPYGELGDSHRVGLLFRFTPPFTQKPS